MRRGGVPTAGAAAILGVLALLPMSACGIFGSTPTPRFTDVPSATLAPPPTPVPPTALPSPTAALPSPTPAGPTPPAVYTFSIVSAEYGYFLVRAAIGSSCSATLTFPDGTSLKLPPKTTAADEKAEWRYPQPPRPTGIAHAAAVCTLRGKSDAEGIDFGIGS